MTGCYQRHVLCGTIMAHRNVMRKLELVISLYPGKTKEFKQSLLGISKKLQEYGSSFIINESDDALSFHILVQWETSEQMHLALKREEFKILSGAIKTLCAKKIIRLDDKQLGNQFSHLNSIY
jgi:hypothetical protein